MDRPSLLARTKERLKLLGIEAKRSLGQNFLINEDVIRKIIVAVRESQPQMLIEVGPGLGALTDELKALGIPLRAIELDQELAEFWRGQGLEVIEADALRTNWSQLGLKAGTVLVSNLPYQISTHIVIDRCLGPAEVQTMVLMFQKEVAERLMAKPRTSDYGLLSVMSQSFWRISRVVDAGPKSFMPAPKVASQVLKFERQPNPMAEVEAKFLSFLKVAFAQRRKLLSKNLLALGGQNQETIAAALTELQIAPKARAEELTVDQFQALFRKLRG